MSKVTSEQFVELAQKSNLADAKALVEAIRTLRSENEGELPADPVQVAKYFEKGNLLTRWHCEKLLQGKYRGFFLGKHKLLGHLGTGGMSTVYLAEHLMLHHKRAIKVLPKSKLGNNSYLLRFQQEAKAIASLNHPNIVRAHDIDNENDTHYIVMEYVEGADLQTIVKKHGPLSYEKVADYTYQAALGLQHAHEKGLIHRDVKPANLLVNREGIVKVLDLGLALMTDDEQSSLTIEHNDKVLGTADYLAPEQALNSHRIDFRADIYALGCSMYFMLTGHAPFPEGSIAQRIAKHQKMMPADIRKDRPDCPGELDGICVKMMQKDPRFRYNDCNQVAAVLENWLQTYRASAIPVKRSVGASVTVGGESSPFPNGLGGAGSKIGSSISSSGLSSGKDLDGDKSGRISSILSLSTSDSGVLQKIASASGSIIDSQINLERDSNAPPAHRRRPGSPKNLAAEQLSAEKRISQIAKANSKKHQTQFDTVTKSQANRNRSAPALKSVSPAASPAKQFSMLTIVAGAVVLLAAAVTLGFFIARWVN